jgi:hypothetical protein
MFLGNLKVKKQLSRTFITKYNPLTSRSIILVIDISVNNNFSLPQKSNNFLSPLANKKVKNNTNDILEQN